MDKPMYEQLKEAIPATCTDCQRRLAALDVVFGKAGPTPSAAAALSRTTTKPPKKFAKGAVVTTTVAQPKPEKDPLIGEPCGVKDCTVKLRSKANTCAVCSKRVCSKHWDRVADCCTACALVAR